jgi:hypothetical protein
MDAARWLRHSGRGWRSRIELRRSVPKNTRIVASMWSLNHGQNAHLSCIYRCRLLYIVDCKEVGRTRWYSVNKSLCRSLHCITCVCKHIVNIKIYILENQFFDCRIYTEPVLLWVSQSLYQIYLLFCAKLLCAVPWNIILSLRHIHSVPFIQRGCNGPGLTHSVRFNMSIPCSSCLKYGLLKCEAVCFSKRRIIDVCKVFSHQNLPFVKRHTCISGHTALSVCRSISKFMKWLSEYSTGTENYNQFHIIFAEKHIKKSRPLQLRKTIEYCLDSIDVVTVNATWSTVVVVIVVFIKPLNLNVSNEWCNAKS